MSRTARSTLGMTLVELMIVVVIVGILAAIAVVGYRKYIGSARVSEAAAMLAEFASKEQLYFLDNGQYSPARADGSSATDEPAGVFWPHNPTQDWDSAREAFAVNPLPGQWKALGIRPRWNQLFCTYMVNAGPPCGVATCPAPSGDVGKFAWSEVPRVPWFYAVGVCNLIGAAGWPGDLHAEKVMVLTHASPALMTIEETH